MWSSVLVYSTRIPLFSRKDPIFCTITRLICFSSSPKIEMAPGSDPPWPASKITVGTKLLFHTDCDGESVFGNCRIKRLTGKAITPIIVESKSPRRIDFTRERKKKLLFKKITSKKSYDSFEVNRSKKDDDYFFTLSFLK